MAQINKLLESKRAAPFVHLDAAGGLSITRVFQNNSDALDRLINAIEQYAEFPFTSDDIRRFYEVMSEVFYDSKSHFGTSAQWLEMRAAEAEDDALVPPEITQIFPKNPEAARAILEEMANSWAEDDAATTGNVEMTPKAVRQQVDKLRKEPEKLMTFIGGRCAAGRYKDAALALRYSRRRALETAKKYSSK